MDLELEKRVKIFTESIKRPTAEQKLKHIKECEEKDWGCLEPGLYKLDGKLYEYIPENCPYTDGCIEDSLWEAKATLSPDWYEDIIMDGVEDYWFVELK